MLYNDNVINKQPSQTQNAYYIYSITTYTTMNLWLPILTFY